MKEAAPVLRVVSVLAGVDHPVALAREALCGCFGSIALESEKFPFDMSGYYEPEMGRDLFRKWFAFERLAAPGDLAGWKLECALLEDRLREGQSRRANLDPGYLDHGKLVLASFKEAPDKIYMGRGVWAHTVLRYRFGHYEAPDHSFPDFRDGRFEGFMLEARKVLRILSRSLRTEGGDQK